MGRTGGATWQRLVDICPPTSEPTCAGPGRDSVDHQRCLFAIDDVGVWSRLMCVTWSCNSDSMFIQSARLRGSKSRATCRHMLAGKATDTCRFHFRKLAAEQGCDSIQRPSC